MKDFMKGTIFWEFLFVNSVFSFEIKDFFLFQGDNEHLNKSTLIPFCSLPYIKCLEMLGDRGGGGFL